MTRPLCILLAAAALLLGVGGTGARWDYTADNTLAAAGAARYERTRCILYWESGGSYDPNQIGRAGELGSAQLHPRGLLSDFYAQGWDDPWNPYQATIYIDQALERGLASHWSPVLLGWC